MKISNIKKISGRVLSYIVSRESIITLITCVAVSIIIGACMVYSRKDEDKSIKVGIIYVGDASTAYTDNFIEALADIKEEYGDKVEVMHMYNVAEGTEREYLERRRLEHDAYQGTRRQRTDLAERTGNGKLE